MNYYQHHIGDYLTRTAHLTLLEHGAYRRLIDVYYSTEMPLPEDTKQVYRLVMARTKEEKEAVDSVLAEFFELADDGFHQHRCDHEIALCDKNRTNGKKGGRPKKTDNPEETQEKPKNNPDGNPEETQTEPNTKAPVTHYPLPDTRYPKGGGDVVSSDTGNSAATDHSPPAESESPTPQGAICKAIRDAGVQNVNPSHPTLLALIEAGATVDEFRVAAGEAVRAKKPNFAYVIGTVKGRREDAAKLQLHKGRLPNKQEAIEQSNASATAGWMPPELREKTA